MVGPIVFIMIEKARGNNEGGKRESNRDSRLEREREIEREQEEC